ncbi:MAG: hypothetical protein K2Q18_13585 [Bdellovibrionales bacterium]|nr:hypothetical protein [Bdellovibrionales bacterium]
MKKTLLILAIAALPTLSFSHEGHDQAPGALKSIHGGVVQAGKQLNLEVIVSGSEITLYPTSHEGKDIPAKDVKIEATAKPKKGKPFPVAFTSTQKGFTSKVDLQGANRLPVTINVTNNGKTDHFTVQVEE